MQSARAILLFLLLFPIHFLIFRTVVAVIGLWITSPYRSYVIFDKILHLIHVSFSRFGAYLNFKLNIIILISCILTCAGALLFSLLFCVFILRLFIRNNNNLIAQIKCNFSWTFWKNRLTMSWRLTVAIRMFEIVLIYFYYKIFCNRRQFEISINIVYNNSNSIQNYFQFRKIWKWSARFMFFRIN